MSKMLSSLFLLTTALASSQAYGDSICRLILDSQGSQDLSPSSTLFEESDPEYDSLESMVAGGQESYALFILEQKFKDKTLTIRQAHLLLRIYRNQQLPLKEVQTAIYIIEVLDYKIFEIHMKLIKAMERLIEQEPSERSSLPEMINRIRPRFENHREFFVFTSRLLYKNRFATEAAPLALRAYDLSDLLSGKIKTLNLRINIAVALDDMNMAHDLREEMNRIDPGNPGSIYWLAYAKYRTLNDSEGALTLIEEFFSLAPNDYHKQRAYALHIRLLVRLGFYVRASSTASTAHAEYPENEIIESLLRSTQGNFDYDDY